MIKKDITILLAFFLIYIFLVMFFTRLSFVALVIPCFIFACCVCKNIKLFKSKKSIIIYLLILIIDISLIVYNSIYRNLPFTNIDWINFDYFAKLAINQSGSNIFLILKNSIDIFTAFIAIIYTVFGDNITLIYFYILPAAQLLSYCTYKIIYEITGNERKSRYGALLILIYPVNFIFALSVLREIPIQLMLTISFYNFLLYWKENKKRNFILAIVFSGIATLMHSGMIGIIIVYFYMAIQRKITKQVKIFKVGALIIAVIFLIIIYISPLWNILAVRFAKLNSGDDIVYKINSQNTILSANTQYITSNATNITDIIITIPYRYIMFIASPFPWQVYSLGTIISLLVDATFRYYIVYSSYKIVFNRKKYNTNTSELITIIFSLIIFTQLIFCLGTNNYGQAMRHRTKVLPMELVLIICFHIDRRRINEEKEKNRNINFS